ncbi:MAG: DNA mismatch repair endonuclease MutL [Spirochaetaceae bacterium]|nr:MAG: DNA mismatch repair endonuclease MutL [Spirochaetaceae bacterium]
MKPGNSPKIHILREDVARRIAAGEVIDRPAAVVRELLDNAIDSGAKEISVYLEEGGNKGIRVTDNGTGMSEEDIGLSILPHATSKIETLEDLERTTSLGFRGEALSSIAAAARLEITSRRKSDSQARMLTVEGGKILTQTAYAGNPGTSVYVSNLFFNMPARKKFLKRPQTEASICKSIFSEKTAAFPEIGFRLFGDGQLKLFLPPDTLAHRIEAIYSDTAFTTGDNLAAAPANLETIQADGEGFSITVVAAPPYVTNRDRKYIHIYANSRRINEYSLVQAVIYACTGYIPGGLFPQAFVFIKVDPQFIDFNIHPAKREARFRNLPEIHSLIAFAIKNHLAQNHTVRPLEIYSRVPEKADIMEPQMFGTPDPGPLNDIAYNAEKTGAQRVIYYGQIWKVFLLASRGETFYLVDQHAAHERIIFDEISLREPRYAELLLPIAFEIEPDSTAFLDKNLLLFENQGFSINKKEDGKYEITCVPEELADAGSSSICDIFKGLSKTATDLALEIKSRIACRKAVKEGDLLDPVSALNLVQSALGLKEPFCPHGRPVILAFTREELYKRFQRIL